MDDSTPTTFVPADDRLFPPLAHSSVWLAIGVVAAVVGVVLLLWILHAVPDAAARAQAVRLTLKGRYLEEIDDLQRRYAQHLIDERQLHHELSRTVRRFAEEQGAPPGALTMTAADLGAAGHDDVADVVATYQPPQFMRRPRSDPPMSVAAARELISIMCERSERTVGRASAGEQNDDGVWGRRSPQATW
jgi:hypothetical protein